MTGREHMRSRCRPLRLSATYDPAVHGTRARWIAGTMAVRLMTFLSGWVLMVRYADWRQSVGYPLILIGALPDALFVRYLVPPQSAGWPIAMVVSLLASSAILVVMLVRDDRGLRQRGRVDESST